VLLGLNARRVVAVLLAVAAVLGIVAWALWPSSGGVQAGNALFDGSSNFYTFRVPMHTNVPLDVSPVELNDYSSSPITLLSLAPASLPKGLHVSGGFMAADCLSGAGRPPAILVYSRSVISQVYIRTWRLHPIAMVPRKVGYCCMRGGAVPGCGFISSDFYPVVTIRATRIGSFRFNGFEATYRQGDQVFREFLHQEYRIDSLGRCKGRACLP
jgi:hypothetical protein